MRAYLSHYATTEVLTDADWRSLARRAQGLELRDAGETVGVLRGARQLVADGWHATFSLDTAGVICGGLDEGVSLFCALDSLVAAAPSIPAAIEAQEYLDSLLGHESWLTKWEEFEGRTKADVVALFDRAILRALAIGRTGRTQ